MVRKSEAPKPRATKEPPVKKPAAAKKGRIGNLGDYAHPKKGTST